MTYRSIGQIPQNGHYISRGARAGIFSGVGQLPTALPGFGVVHEGGLRRVDPSARGSLVVAIGGSTSTAAPGSSMTPTPGYHDSVVVFAPFAFPGNNWVSEKLGQGYVVLVNPTNSPQGVVAEFTKDPQFIADHAGPMGVMAVLDGSEGLVNQAKAILSGGASTGGCPSGTFGIPPNCFPVPGPETPLPNTGCPDGTVGIPPNCFPIPTQLPTTPPTLPVPGLPTTPPTLPTTLPTIPPTPEIEPPSEEKDDNTMLYVAGAGVAAVALIALLAAK